MVQANYLKNIFCQNNHKKKFKFYVLISNQNINLKLIYIKIDSKIYIFKKMIFTKIFFNNHYKKCFKYI